MNDLDISIIIPVYNEYESLEILYEKIVEVFPHEKIECIFVNDGSTDESLNVLKRIQKKASIPVTIVSFRKNYGKSAALSVGFSRAKGSIVVTMDADLQDDPENIPQMIKKLDEGYDLVSGWREKRNDPFRKVFLSKIFNKVVSSVSGLQLHDFNIGLKVYRKEVVKEIHLYGELHRFIPFLASARGFRVAEVPIKHYARKYGKSKYGSKRVIKASFDLFATMFLLTFKRQPLQLFGIIGVAFIFSGLLILSYLTSIWLFGASIGRRPLLLLGILFFLFGTQLFITGLLAELITNYQHSNTEYSIAEIIEK